MIRLILIFIFLTLSCTNEKIEFRPNNVEVEFESKMTDRNKYLNDKYEKYIDMTEDKVGNDVALFPTLTKKQVEQDLDFFCMLFKQDMLFMIDLVEMKSF